MYEGYKNMKLWQETNMELNLDMGGIIHG
jgi:hypothetical protein